MEIIELVTYQTHRTRRTDQLLVTKTQTQTSTKLRNKIDERQHSVADYRFQNSGCSQLLGYLTAGSIRIQSRDSSAG